MEHNLHLEIEEYKRSQEYLKTTDTRETKRLVDKTLGVETFSERLKRQMKEKRLSK